MTTTARITAKNTKAQLLQHIEEQSTLLAHAEQELHAAQPTPIKEQVAAVINELIALVEDTYRLGAWCRKGSEQVLTELRSMV